MTHMQYREIYPRDKPIKILHQIQSADYDKAGFWFERGSIRFAKVQTDGGDHEKRAASFQEFLDFWQAEIDSAEKFWSEKLAWSDGIRIEGKHYRAGKQTNAPSYCKGFGGSKFVIEFFDGRVIETDNLWHQGTIPPVWRAKLPDNARFKNK